MTKEESSERDKSIWPASLLEAIVLTVGGLCFFPKQQGPGGHYPKYPAEYSAPGLRESERPQGKGFHQIRLHQ